MISHEAGFPALHMTDHVPFYTTLSCKGLHFCNTLFRIIFPKDPYAGFHGRLNDFDRLGFRHDHQSDFIGIAVALACGICNLVEGMLVICANRGNEVGHVIIIIFPASTLFSVNYCSEIKAPKRPVRPFSARCENQSSVWQAVQISDTWIWPTPARSSERRLASHKLKWILP